MILNQEIPGCDENGFMPFQSLCSEARREAAGAFSERYPMPALYIADVGSAPQDDGEAAPDSEGVQLLTMMDRGKSAFRYLDQVGFLVKRPGNPFPSFVSVGRAANNDLVIGVETVSKLHAYFTVDGGDWYLTDYSSTNGTRLNDRPVPAETPARVADGDRILFGKEISAVFMSPESLYTRARGRR